MKKSIVCGFLATLGTVLLSFDRAVGWETTANFISSFPNGTKKGFVAPSGAATIEPPSEYNVPFPDDSAVSLGEGFDLISADVAPAD
jgi:hypothetical protein